MSHGKIDQDYVEDYLSSKIDSTAYILISSFLKLFNNLCACLKFHNTVWSVVNILSCIGLGHLFKIKPYPQLLSSSCIHSTSWSNRS